MRMPRLRHCLALLLLLSAQWMARSAPVELKPNDVITFLGGSDLVTAQELGHFESILRAHHPGVRVRSLAWEADTVFAQPRDFKYPPLTNQLEKIGATIVICQFGQAESFGGGAKLGDFKQAYASFLKTIGPARRTLLITPHPFEFGPGALQNPDPANDRLDAYASATRDVAREQRAILLDLHSALRARPARFRLTSDGWHLNARGHAYVAQQLAHAFGVENATHGAADEKGRWANPHFEKLRLEIIEKNRLWFDYSRPMNWAFLGGDRVEQPSSRDHRDPSIRWFPAEMEKFVPLIEQRESRIEELAREVRP